MTRFPEAIARLFGRVFVCKRCKSKLRADPSKIRANKIICKKCNSKAFRPIKSKK